MERAEKIPDNVTRREAAAQREPGPIAASAFNGYRIHNASLRATAEMIDRSPWVQAQKAFSTAIDNSPNVVAQRKQIRSLFGHAAQLRDATVQRVKIGEFDITKASSLDDIIQALAWSRNWGIRATVDEDTLEAILHELTGRKDCEDIIEDIETRLQPDEDVENIKLVLDEQALLSQEEQQKFRRGRAEAFGWATYPEVIDGHRKLGVHETASGNIKGLVETGPNADKFGTGHGTGKGLGFYVTHVGQQTLYNAIKAIRYEDNFVAVYVPESYVEYRSSGDQYNSVAAMDELHGDEENCYYVMSGGSEIIIPPRSFEWVKIVSSREDFENW